MSKKFKYVIVSKDSSFSLGSEEVIKQLQSQDREIKLVSNNTRSLPEVYNDELSTNADFLVLMHADVKLDIQSLEKHVLETETKYDIFGLCGTSVLNVSQSPLNWWTGSNPTPTSKWGFVYHGELGNQPSFFSQHSPSVTDHEVACIDGLCIIFSKKAMQSGIKFDPIFKFDFYDTDISMQAVMKHGLCLGVLVEKSLQHYSIGKSILTKDFLMHELDFRKKWSLDIPESSPLKQLAAKA